MATEGIEAEAGVKVVKSICRMCSHGCGIFVHLKDGKAVDIDVNREHYPGSLCYRAKGMLEWVYSPERLTTPLQKKNGGWKEISWDSPTD